MGKHGTCYDASPRKMVRKTETSQHAKYTCSFCSKTKKKRRAVAAGGAWTFIPTSAVTVKAASERRPKELKDQEKHHHLTTLPSL
ncbi:hypothetical protein AB1E18_017592 [Capra hircus]